MLGEAVVPIPAPSDTAADLDRDPLELNFAGPPFDERLDFNRALELLEHEGVAKSPVRSDAVSKWISGRIVISAVWGVDEEGRSLGPVQTSRLVALRGDEVWSRTNTIIFLQERFSKAT